MVGIFVRIIFQWGGPRVPSHGIPRVPKGSPPMGGPGPFPWDPFGSQGFPLPWDPLPWDPLGLPRVPSHGVPPHPPDLFCLSHMAIEGVLARQKCAGKWCATFWAPVSPNQVTKKCQIFNFHDFSDILVNSLHHSIPPNWFLGLQIGPRISLKARVSSQALSNQ